jgi:hypothetical protein
MTWRGAVALWDRGRVEPVLDPRSDRLGEFSERSGDPPYGRGVDGEFVVTTAKVLHEDVPALLH